jgi:hypothetical protein
VGRVAGYRGCLKAAPHCGNPDLRRTHRVVMPNWKAFFQGTILPLDGFHLSVKIGPSFNELGHVHSAKAVQLLRTMLQAAS